MATWPPKHTLLPQTYCPPNLGVPGRPISSPFTVAVTEYSAKERGLLPLASAGSKASLSSRRCKPATTAQPSKVAAGLGSQMTRMVTSKLSPCCPLLLAAGRVRAAFVGLEGGDSFGGSSPPRTTHQPPLYNNADPVSRPGPAMPVNK